VGFGHVEALVHQAMPDLSHQHHDGQLGLDSPDGWPSFRALSQKTHRNHGLEIGENNISLPLLSKPSKMLL
jgi:hypothetical protein